MSTVRVISPCVVVFEGVPVPLHSDQPFDSEDAIVVQYPWMFAADNAGEVEQASAAPGEKRTARR